MAISRIYVRRDTAQNWESSNVVLNVGEFGYDITNKTVKIGDGTTAWNDLVPIQSVTTNNVTNEQITNINSDITEIEQSITNIQQIIPTSITDFEDTPDAYISGKRNMIITEDGEIEFVGDGMIVDGEYRGMMNNLLHHRPALMVTEGDEYDIDSMNQNVLVYRSPNNTVRNLRLIDEFGQGGNDVYIRIDGGEPTCSGGGDYDPETNSCFPADQNVVAASTFQNAYNPDLSGVYTGAHPISGRVRILKTGLYATGWIDVHQIHDDVASATANLSSNTATISSLQTDVDALKEAGTGVLGAYNTNDLPLAAGPANVALVTDGSATNTPTMGYFYEGKWYRTLDNVELADKTVDIFLLAGQSNAHGHADVDTLTEAQKTQDGLFYTSWHQNTSNASTTQYYSSWATSLVAGDTRGDSNSPTLGGSTMFGPELGFVNRANEIELTDGKPIGILKHAIGASSLTHPDATEGDLSDWDLTPEGDKHGDALVAFKLAIADGLQKLTDAGYSYRLAGMIWWQGESNGNAPTSDLVAFIDHIRTWLDDENYISMPKTEFPFVITGTTSYWGTNYEAEVADRDAYIGFVNSQDLAAPSWADRTLVHPGSSSETYPADQNDIDSGYTGAVGDEVGSADFNGDGVNDMFAIGRAYADQMQLAKSGNTSSSFDPASITTRLWIDTADASTLLYDANGNVSTINDKSGNQTNLDASSGSTITAVPSGLNGLNILSFDNNADATTYENLSLQSNTRHKWFMVMKATASDQYDGFLTYRSSNPTNELILFNYSSAGNFKAEWYVNSGTAMRGNSTNLLGTWNILSVEFDIPNAQSSAWLNGTAYNTNVAQNGSNFPSIGAGQLSINQYGTKGGADWAELIFTENPTQAESEKIEGYLAHKWGLTANLPESHPYKSSAP